MLTIRLQPTGRKRSKTFRIVIAEKSAAVSGKSIETLGSMVATDRSGTLKIDTERAAYWISVGAQPSESIARILVGQGVKSAEKFISKRIMKPSKAEVAEKAAAEEAKKAAAEAKKAEAEAKAAAEQAAAEAAAAPAVEETAPVSTPEEVVPVAEETPATPEA